MIGKLPFLAVFVSTWIAPVSQEEVDVAHYVPGAQRKVFETRVERTAQRVALRLDGRSYDLSELLGREPSGTAEWNLSVRDSPKFEAWPPVVGPRDHEGAEIGKRCCRDGQGRHRLAERLVRWDKDTGERIWLDEKSPTKKKK